MDPKKKFWLFKQAQNFCSVPWNHFEVFSTGDIKTCSKGIPFGNINQTPIEEILKDPWIVSLKQDLFNDKLISNCKGCHQLTTTGEHFDLRNHYNPMFKNFNIDYTDTHAFDLHGIDLHWNNTCNFKCIYCNAQQSSSIAKEQNISVNNNNTKTIDSIIAMIMKNQYTMKEIYLSGGEPLLIKHNAKLLSMLENKDIPIRINSNISVATDNNPVFAEIKKFTNVLWTLSAEASSGRFNYIRHGGNWETFLENLNRIKKLGHNLRLNSVFFVGSLASIFDNIEYFITEHGVTDITINQLSGHEYLLGRNAPDELKTSTLVRLQKLLESGLVEYKSNSYYNISRCQAELTLPINDETGYIDYFDNIDRLRNTNWRQVFVELVK
jgi:molybdenum cofactor biosynthesis enzyme MoaA